MKINIQDGILYGIEDLEPYNDKYVEVFKDTNRNKYFIHFHRCEGFHTIAPYAFANRDDIFGITINVDQIKLSEGSFYACQSLGIVVIFNSSRKDYDIPDYCFARCGVNGLNYYERKYLIINLPYGIRRIGKGAFMNSGLSSFNHPENIVNMVYYNSVDNKFVETYYEGQDSDYYRSLNKEIKNNYMGYYYIFPFKEYSKNAEVYLDLVDDYYSNESELFDFSRLIYIGQYAFYNCYGLTTATNFGNNNEDDVIDNKFLPFNADIIRTSVNNEVITTVNNVRNYFQFPKDKTIEETYHLGYNNTLSEYMNGDYGKYYDYIDNDLFTFNYTAKGSSGKPAPHNSGNKKLLYDNTTLELYRRLPNKDQAMQDKVFLPNPYSMYISYWCCDNLFECFNYCYGYLMRDEYDFNNENIKYGEIDKNEKAVLIYPCKLRESEVSRNNIIKYNDFNKENSDQPIRIGDFPLNPNTGMNITSNAQDFFKLSYRRMYEDGVPNGPDYKITNYPDCETYYSCSLTMANEVVRPDYRNTPYNVEEIRDLLKKHLMKKITKDHVGSTQDSINRDLIKKYKTLYWENFKETEY